MNARSGTYTDYSGWSPPLVYELIVYSVKGSCNVGHTGGLNNSKLTFGKRDDLVWMSTVQPVTCQKLVRRTDTISSML